MQNRRLVVVVGAVAGAALAIGMGARALSGKPGPQERRSSLVQRTIAPIPPSPSPTHEALRNAPTAEYPLEFRAIDGSNNNLIDPTWGAAGTPFLRLADPAYSDGVHAPARLFGPSAREVSNAIATQLTMTPNAKQASDFLWQWGQFLDHDIDETPVAGPAEEFDILVPVGDPAFDPTSSGSVRIPLDRSGYTLVDGVREQINLITAYIDASNVYGSDSVRAAELRTLDGTGRLKTSAGDLLPFNTAGLPNAMTTSATHFLGGDVRANEQVGLTAMHTLFVREHNHWADQIRADEPTLTGDEVYERARAIVAAEMQAITFREFLPILLGPKAIPPYSGYDDHVNPGITNEFATAGYRVGHTLLSPTLRRLDASGVTIGAGDLSLRDAFFVPQQTIDHGVDPVLRGLASQMAQEIDCHVVADVRDFLFGPPGAGGFDLASLNLQRGRDHGLGSYNDIREAVGRPRAVTFNDICPDPALAAAFASVYATPDDVDPWIGLLAEPHHADAMVGETLYLVLRDQFIRLRYGDRFWYEAYLPPDLVDLVNQQTLATIIRRNTGIDGEIQDDVFRVGPACAGDFNDDGAIDGADLGLLLGAWGTPVGDLNGDGVTDGADLGLLLGAWGACS